MIFLPRTKSFFLDQMAFWRRSVSIDCSDSISDTKSLSEHSLRMLLRITRASNHHSKKGSFSAFFVNASIVNASGCFSNSSIRNCFSNYASPPPLALTRR